MILYYSYFYNLHWDACGILVLHVTLRFGIGSYGLPTGENPWDITIAPSNPLIFQLAVRVACGRGPRGRYESLQSKMVEIEMICWYFDAWVIDTYVLYLMRLCYFALLLVIALESWQLTGLYKLTTMLLSYFRYQIGEGSIAGRLLLLSGRMYCI